MTPARQPKDCAYLLRRGMSVLCIDSTDPSRKNCDHCISPQCFSTHTSPPAPDKLLNALILWLNDNRTGAIIRPYGEEKIIMVLDCERTIKQIKAMWPRTHPAPVQQHTECYLDGYNDGSKAAREQVLNDALTMIHPDSPAGKVLQSLRAQQEEK